MDSYTLKKQENKQNVERGRAPGRRMACVKAQRGAQKVDMDTLKETEDYLA